MKEGQRKREVENKLEKKKNGQSTRLATRNKNIHISVPPHSSHKADFVTRRITLPEIKLGNFGFIILVSIRTGKHGQQM